MAETTTPILLRAAAPTVEDGLVFARLLDEARDACTE
jgi:hypothetical protein